MSEQDGYRGRAGCAVYGGKQGATRAQRVNRVRVWPYMEGGSQHAKYGNLGPADRDVSVLLLPVLAVMHLLPALFLFLPSLLAVSGRPNNDSETLLWGPYRPNLYFGMRPRLPQSLMTGLIWFGTQDFKSFSRKSRTP